MIIECAQPVQFVPVEVKISIKTQEEYSLFKTLVGNTASIPRMLVECGKINKTSQDKLTTIMSHIFLHLRKKTNMVRLDRLR